MSTHRRPGRDHARTTPGVLSGLRSHHDFMVGYTRAVLRSLARPILLWLLFATATCALADALLFLWLESDHNPGVRSFFDALYFTVTTITGVGFGDVVPVTRAGKMLAMASMLGGTGLFVTYTAVLASSIIDVELSQRGREP